jgi:hypothetical protein
MTALAPYLSAFLLEHLPRERKASPHTSDAYAHSFKLLVCFAAARLHVKPFQIEIEQLDVPTILAFLEHIENDRSNTARTRNARLTAIHSFLFLRGLAKAFAAGELNVFSAYRHLHEPAAFRCHLAPAHHTKWVVYAKRPFAGPDPADRGSPLLPLPGTHRSSQAGSCRRSVPPSTAHACIRRNNREKKTWWNSASRTLENGLTGADSSYGISIEAPVRHAAKRNSGPLDLTSRPCYGHCRSAWCRSTRVCPTKRVCSGR